MKTETPSAPSHTPEPWHVCGHPDKVCQCMMISDEHGPICTVTSGKWGDDYPALRFVEGDAQGGIDAKVEAYMDQITYGEVPVALAEANANRIVSCVNAMAGIANPEAVRDAIEAARDLLILSECADETGYVEDVGFMDIDAIQARARKALAALEAK